MLGGRYKWLLLWMLSAAGYCQAQRQYALHSVLNEPGTWYRISTRQPGIYRLDLAFLNSLGINTSNLSSSSIRIFGNGGRRLPESNAGTYLDDLVENAILVQDGGDGVLNGNDQVVFYSGGPDEWIRDSLSQSFTHRRNIYSTKSFYYLYIGGNGKRISLAPAQVNPTITIRNFQERIFHELDTVNFLNSGKEWYGEELSELPGRSRTRIFSVPILNAVTGTPMQIRFNAVARSVGAGSRMDILLNGQNISTYAIPAVAGGIYDIFAQQLTAQLNGGSAQLSNQVQFNFTPGSFNAQGWVNWWELMCRRELSMNGSDQLLFRDWLSVGNARGEFVISDASANIQVWDITDPLVPQRMNGAINAGEFRFINDCSRLREYIAFNNNNYLVPVNEGRIANQDLHNSTAAELLLITHPSLFTEARRLADFHIQQGMQVKIFTTDQVYNEFSSGNPDPAAIRNLAKMYWDRYKNTALPPRYLILFGDASFDPLDRIKNNTSLVPAWENENALDPLGTYCSDDFYGFLDDNEDINALGSGNLLDLGIGRIPAKTIMEARQFVDKLIRYHSATGFGPWRNEINLIADDEDNDLHLQDAEIMSATAGLVAPVLNQKKIYLDAYRQESSAGGSVYPAANQAITSQAYNGSLIWNYNGHGGPDRLAEETIFDVSILNGWNNPDRLPLFITATCDFAPYDHPLINSLGENLLLRSKTGGIALMTTTRPVFAFSNRIMNDNYLRFALQRDGNGNYKRLGDAVKEAKNFTYQNSGDITNNRKFSLLGDPAMRLAFPTLKIAMTKVNGLTISAVDTLSATELVTMEGEVRDWQDQVITGFNGNVYPTVYDKPAQLTTLGNDPGSPPVSFISQTNVLFRGKASVLNGRFSFQFRMPKDINYQYGNGRLSLYAEDSVKDGNGYFTQFIVGGNSTTNSGDRDGPVIKAWMNNESFVNGGVTEQAPILLLKLSDSSGINTSGAAIDHDIVATLDNDNRRYFVLNDYYQGEVNDYKKGSVRFQLPSIEPGNHSLHIKAWDVLNNSGETRIDFLVAKDESLQLGHVLNYPNPFINNTSFWFEHNKPGQMLTVTIQIMTITGRVIKEIRKQVTTDGNRCTEIEWDGRDEQGQKLGRGVYLYKLRVSAGSLSKEVLEKLVIL